MIRSSIGEKGKEMGDKDLNSSVMRVPGMTHGRTRRETCLFKFQIIKTTSSLTITIR